MSSYCRTCNAVEERLEALLSSKRDLSAGSTGTATTAASKRSHSRERKGCPSPSTTSPSASPMYPPPPQARYGMEDVKQRDGSDRRPYNYHHHPHSSSSRPVGGVQLSTPPSAATTAPHSSSHSQNTTAAGADASSVSPQSRPSVCSDARRFHEQTMAEVERLRREIFSSLERGESESVETLPPPPPQTQTIQSIQSQPKTQQPLQHYPQRGEARSASGKTVERSDDNDEEEAVMMSEADDNDRNLWNVSAVTHQAQAHSVFSPPPKLPAEGRAPSGSLHTNPQHHTNHPPPPSMPHAHAYHHQQYQQQQGPSSSASVAPMRHGPPSISYRQGTPPPPPPPPPQDHHRHHYQPHYPPHDPYSYSSYVAPRDQSAPPVVQTTALAQPEMTSLVRLVDYVELLRDGYQTLMAAVQEDLTALRIEVNETLDRRVEKAVEAALAKERMRHNNSGQQQPQFGYPNHHYHQYQYKGVPAPPSPYPFSQGPTTAASPCCGCGCACHRLASAASGDDRNHRRAGDHDDDDDTSGGLQSEVKHLQKELKSLKKRLVYIEAASSTTTRRSREDDGKASSPATIVSSSPTAQQLLDKKNTEDHLYRRVLAQIEPVLEHSRRLSAAQQSMQQAISDDVLAQTDSKIRVALHVVEGDVRGLEGRLHNLRDATRSGLHHIATHVGCSAPVIS